MAKIEFTNLLIVAIAAFAAPLVLGLFPGVRLPAVVLEIVAGILIGPAVFGWVEFIIPVLMDTGQAATEFGQVVIAGASIAEVATCSRSRGQADPAGALCRLRARGRPRRRRL